MTISTRMDGIVQEKYPHNWGNVTAFDVQILECETSSVDDVNAIMVLLSY